MKNIDSSPYHSLACLEVASIAFGYRALKALTDNSDSSRVRILDASPAGSRFMILALGETDALTAAIRRARASFDGAEPDLVIDVELIEGVHASVREAIFALPQVPLEDSLVVIECATVSGCLSAAQTLVSGHGLKTIELRVLRSSSGGAYGFFTGPKSTCASAAADALARAKTALRQARIEVIEAPSNEFRSFFELKS